ncbi:MAG TPA: peptide-methionine (S)-S-oxide reductase, partial [Bacteroidales bacterium]|nr:peptide-methionine (S)-S-oxide reductase [Bacteroidales bacterium]
FDPNQINFGQLLEVFFKTHDPTTLNRQGGDLGTQYRSVIFYHSEQQKLLSEKSIAELNKEGIWENPIVTVVEPFDVYYPAENYHRDYYKNNPNQQYCSLVIHPKIEKFKKVFGALLK